MTKLEKDLYRTHDDMLNVLRKAIKAVKIGTQLYDEIKLVISDAEDVEAEILFSNK